MNKAEELIACLEREVANRDAELCERTEEVEHALADLNNALAELAAIKAHGVVMPQSPHWPADDSHLSDYERGHLQGRCDMRSEVIRLNAAPAQQVSVPDGLELIKRMQVCLSLDDTEWGLSAPEKYKLLGDIKSYVLAAPAAPAADAGHVFYGMDGNHP